MCENPLQHQGNVSNGSDASGRVADTPQPSHPAQAPPAVSESERFILDTQVPTENSPQDVGPFMDSQLLFLPPSATATATPPIMLTQAPVLDEIVRVEELVPDTHEFVAVSRPRYKTLKTRKSHGWPQYAHVHANVA